MCVCECDMSSSYRPSEAQAHRTLTGFIADDSLLGGFVSGVALAFSPAPLPPCLSP